MERFSFSPERQRRGERGNSENPNDFGKIKIT
jgi:hypothetical protein